MADIYIKVQGFFSWNEGKFTVEKSHLDWLISNTDSTAPEKSVYNYYSDQEIKCVLTIPWELLTLFNDLESDKKMDRIVEEDNQAIASKVIYSDSAPNSVTIPKLFSDDEVQLFPYWMYKYNPMDPNSKKEGRSVFERNELSINPNLLALFLNRVSEKIIPLNVFSKQEQVKSFVERALVFCEFAKIYHIRISFDSGY